MGFAREQAYELEALREIYYHEIKVISSEQPISFSIKIRPQASSYEELEIIGDSDDEDDESEDEYDYNDESEIHDSSENTALDQDFSVEILFELPFNYPNEKPSIQIMNSHDFEEYDLEILTKNLDKKSEECLGNVMVFILVNYVVEWLVKKSEKDEILLEEEKSARQKDIDEEAKRFDGTPVTKQSFLAWKARFDAEMLKASLERQKQLSEGISGTNRLTGRAMFESDQTLVESDLNFVEDLDQNQIEALLHNIDDIDLGDEGDFEIELGSEDEDLDLEDEVSEEESDPNSS